VQPNRQGDGFQILLNNETKIEQSSRALDTVDLKDEAEKRAPPVTIEQLSSYKAYDRVTIVAKVIKLTQPDTIKEISHQDVFAADQTGVIRVSLWGESVSFLEQGKTYKLTNFTIGEFRSKMFLSTPKHDFHISKADDIEVNVTDDPDVEEDKVTLTDVNIVGVPMIDAYKSCLQCKARVEPITPPLGKCTKQDCAMIQNYDFCSSHQSAKLIIKAASSDKFVHLSIYGQLLQKLVNSAPSQKFTAQSLLILASWMKFNISRTKKL